MESKSQLPSLWRKRYAKVVQELFGKIHLNYPQKKNVWDWNNSIMDLGLTCHTSGWSLKISESDVFVFFFGDVVRVKEKWKCMPQRKPHLAPTVQLKMLQKSQRSLVSIEMFDMDVSENSGTPKSSILIGFSMRNHPFWGIPIFGTTHMGVRRPEASAEKTTVKTLVFLAVDDQKQLNFWSSFSWISKNSALATVCFKLNKVQVKKSTFGGFCG